MFIVPPSLEALFQRLRSRATETADELEIRQRNAAIELARQGDYDHVVVNETGEVERTAAEIEAIIEQEKRRNARPADPRSPERTPCRPRSAWTSAAVGRAGRRPLVEVAVDAPAGPGPRTYTYLVPAGARRRSSPARRCSCRSARAAARRSASCVGPGARPPRTRRVRPIAARVRSDGPLLPPLALALRRAASPSGTWRPLAIVIRAMLPPGMLERLELVAEVTPAGEARLGAAGARACPPAELDLLDELAGRAACRCATCPRPRAARRSLRRLRALADDGPRGADVDAARGGRRARATSGGCG